MEKDRENGKKDLTGRRFGHLVVLEKTQRRENCYVVWLCRCDCGNTIPGEREGLRLCPAGECEERSLCGGSDRPDFWASDSGMPV